MSGATLPLSIRTDGDDIEIVNQLLLPHVVEFVKINSIEGAHEAIKSMKVWSSYFNGVVEGLLILASPRFEAHQPSHRLRLLHSHPHSLGHSKRLQHQNFCLLLSL